MDEVDMVRKDYLSVLCRSSVLSENRMFSKHGFVELCDIMVVLVCGIHGNWYPW